MTCSQDADLRGLATPWPTTATILTGGAAGCSAVTAEKTVVGGQKRVRGGEGKEREAWA